MDATVTFVRDEAVAVRALQALATAWSTYNLYPNPADQPAFDMALATLGDPAALPLDLEVGPGVFIQDGVELDVARDGAGRLAKQLFIQDVEVLRVVSPPSARDLVEVFDILIRDKDEIRAAGGVFSFVEATGVRSLVCYQRGMLTSGDDDEDHEGLGKAEDEEEEDLAGRRMRVVAAVEHGLPPEEIAASLEEKAEGDPRKVADEFGSAYAEMHAHLAEPARDHGTIGPGIANYVVENDPSATVRTFAETFFHLDQAAQVEILEDFVGRSEETIHRTFLDQFSGDDLARLAPLLEEETYERLVGYARVAAVGEGARAEDVLPLLQSAGEVKEARKAVATRVSDVLLGPKDDESTSVPAIHSQMVAELEEVGAGRELGQTVIRGLFECEDREQRFLRVSRIWTGRVSRLVRAGQFDAAAELLASVLDDPPFPARYEPVVEDALEKLVSFELLQTLVERTADGGDLDEAVVILKAFGPDVVDLLIDQLAEEEDSSRRRTLMDLLAVIGRIHPRRLIARFDDPRWYVLRNLAVVAGKTGRPEMGAGLTRLMKHDDHRVRVDALRAATVLMKDRAPDLMIGSLADEHPRVRNAAIALLRGSDPDSVIPLLADHLSGDDVSSSDVAALIDLLAEWDDPAAARALEDLASSKFALRSSRRSVRDAARAALKGRTQ